MGLRVCDDIEALEAPCRDYHITSLRAGLAFPHGTIANTNTSMWLDHAVLVSFAQIDMSCTEREDAYKRILALGNERPLVNFAIRWTNIIAANGTVVMVSQASERGAIAARRRHHHRLGIHAKLTSAHRRYTNCPAPYGWTSMAACGAYWAGASEVPGPTDSEPVPFRLGIALAWDKSTVTDKVVQGIPLLHDGWVVLKTAKNGHVVCLVETRYGDSPDLARPDPRRDAGNGYRSGSRTSRLWTVSRLGQGHKLAVAWSIGEDEKPGSIPSWGLSVMYVLCRLEECRY